MRTTSYLKDRWTESFDNQDYVRGCLFMRVFFNIWKSFKFVQNRFKITGCYTIKSKHSQVHLALLKLHLSGWLRGEGEEGWPPRGRQPRDPGSALTAFRPSRTWGEEDSPDSRESSRETGTPDARRVDSRAPLFCGRRRSGSSKYYILLFIQRRDLEKNINCIM